MKLKDPQKNYNFVRSNTFKTFQGTQDFDLSLDIIEKSNLDKKSKRGLKGELIFLKKNFGKVVQTNSFKADFKSITGQGFFDVTTDLTWKDPSDYIKFPNKNYKIALVDIESEDISVIPISVPKCHYCNKMTFFIAMLSHLGENNGQVGLSDDQTVFRYCPYDEDFEKADSFSFLINSPYTNAEEFEDIVPVPQEERNKILNQGSVNIMHFLSKQSTKILFGLGETIYQITDKDGDGHFGTYLYWIKPCGKAFLDNFLDYYLEGDSTNIRIPSYRL